MGYGRVVVDDGESTVGGYRNAGSHSKAHGACHTCRNWKAIPPVGGQDTVAPGSERLWLLRSSPDQVHAGALAPGPAADRGDGEPYAAGFPRLPLRLRETRVVPATGVGALTKPVGRGGLSRQPH